MHYYYYYYYYYFAWRPSSLEQVLLKEGKGKAELGSVASIGFTTHWKPGAPGLVRELRRCPTQSVGGRHASPKALLRASRCRNRPLPPPRE